MAIPAPDRRWTMEAQMADGLSPKPPGWAPGRPFDKRPVEQPRRPSGRKSLQPEGEILL
jgi:hypothetical protein